MLHLCFNRVYRWWSCLPLIQKMRTVFIMIISVFILMAMLTIAFSEGQVYTFSNIMAEYHDVGRLINSFRSERILFRSAIYSSMDFPSEEYEQARTQVNQAVRQLQRLEHSENAELQMFYHAVNSAMESYRQDESLLYNMLKNQKNREPDFISGYYRLEVRAEYINQYAAMLLESSIEAGEHTYDKARETYIYIYLIFALGIILCTCVLFGASQVIQHSMLGPVLSLSRAAEQITNGGFNSPDVLYNGHDELATLANTFNIMKHELSHTFDTLMEKAEMEKHLRQQEVENEQMQKLLERTRFAQLQSQMNPHFLFNSLNTASALATLEYASQTSEMLGELAAFFRYTLENEIDLVPLSQELDIIETYMGIQQRRFGERLTLIMDRHPEFENLQIPKFILQPLVENSVIHGLSHRLEGGTIRVRICEPEDGLLEIHITDNGIGVDSSHYKPEKTSVGIQNIRARLAIFDSKSSLSFWGRKGLGACVRLRFHIYEAAKTE